MKSVFTFMLFFITSLVYGLDQNELNYPWSKHAGSEEKNLLRLIRILSQSKTGRGLLKDAKKKAHSWGKTIFDVLKEGEGSLTDTTIHRKFSANNALEVRHESVSVVSINRSLNTYDAVLDLAHELTHFSYREEFNPYINTFSASEFIKKTIEGNGGEVDAYVVECKVSEEIFSNFNRERKGCSDIKEKGEFSRSIAKNRFYQLGPYYHNFFSEVQSKYSIKKNDVLKKLPNINKKDIEFYSSAHSVPYPLAALLEYGVIVSTACKNDHKRLQYIQSSLRKPASNMSNKLYRSLVLSFEKRCRNYL